MSRKVVDRPARRGRRSGRRPRRRSPDERVLGALARKSNQVLVEVARLTARLDVLEHAIGASRRENRQLIARALRESDPRRTGGLRLIRRSAARRV